MTAEELKLRKTELFYREQRVTWGKTVTGLLLLAFVMGMVGYFVPFFAMNSREVYGTSNVVMGSDTAYQLFRLIASDNGLNVNVLLCAVWPVFALVLAVLCRKCNKLFTGTALAASGVFSLLQGTFLFLAEATACGKIYVGEGYEKVGLAHWVLNTSEKVINKTLIPHVGLILWWMFSLLMIAVGLYVLFIRNHCTNLSPRIRTAEDGTTSDAGNGKPLLRVEHLCQYFGFTKAVDDISFDIKKGEVFGLVGESGCGKTTTGRSIIKLYDITSGNIFFNGVRIGAGVQSYKNAIVAARTAYKEKVTADPANRRQYASELSQFIAEQKLYIREAEYDQKYCDAEYQFGQVARVKAEYEPRLAAAQGKEAETLKAEYANRLRKAGKTRLITKIQMIFQDPSASLDPRMTVREIISEGLIIQGERDKEVLDKAVYEMLEKVGLVREHAGRYQHEFSGGQRQRIGIARSVVMKPQMIIADEPVSALDVSIQAQVINLLNDLRHELGLTIMFIAHDLSVVKETLI